MIFLSPRWDMLVSWRVDLSKDEVNEDKTDSDRG